MHKYIGCHGGEQEHGHEAAGPSATQVSSKRDDLMICISWL
jgi:hypothetical protein